jgi:predicted aspartyl protease
VIRGAVNARCEAVVRLRVRGPGGVESDVDLIVDSGFTSTLTLPVALVTALGLTRKSGSAAVLADGSLRQFDIYAAEVEWGRQLACGVGLSRRQRTAVGNASSRGPQIDNRCRAGRLGGNPSAPLRLAASEAWPVRPPSYLSFVCRKPNVGTGCAKCRCHGFAGR